jgi:hypothetical protein
MVTEMPFSNGPDFLGINPQKAVLNEICEAFCNTNFSFCRRSNHTTWNPKSYNLQNKSHNLHPKRASKLIMELYSYILSKSFEFHFSDEQELALNEWLIMEHQLASSKSNWFAISPIIKRMGLVVIKISMIIATIRAWESNNQEEQLAINSDDFDIVMQLCRVYFQHAGLDFVALIIILRYSRS